MRPTVARLKADTADNEDIESACFVNTLLKNIFFFRKVDNVRINMVKLKYSLSISAVTGQGKETAWRL